MDQTTGGSLATPPPQVAGGGGQQQQGPPSSTTSGITLRAAVLRQHLKLLQRQGGANATTRHPPVGELPHYGVGETDASSSFAGSSTRGATNASNRGAVSSSHHRRAVGGRRDSVGSRSSYSNDLDEGGKAIVQFTAEDLDAGRASGPVPGTRWVIPKVLLVGPFPMWAKGEEEGGQREGRIPGGSSSTGSAIATTPTGAQTSASLALRSPYSRGLGPGGSTTAGAGSNAPPGAPKSPLLGAAHMTTTTLSDRDEALELLLEVAKVTTFISLQDNRVFGSNRLLYDYQAALKELSARGQQHHQALLQGGMLPLALPVVAGGAGGEGDGGGGQSGRESPASEQPQHHQQHHRPSDGVYHIPLAGLEHRRSEQLLLLSAADDSSPRSSSHAPTTSPATTSTLSLLGTPNTTSTPSQQATVATAGGISHGGGLVATVHSWRANTFLEQESEVAQHHQHLQEGLQFQHDQLLQQALLFGGGASPGALAAAFPHPIPNNTKAVSSVWLPLDQALNFEDDHVACFTLDALERILARQETVYVHCTEGYERSNTFAALLCSIIFDLDFTTAQTYVLRCQASAIVGANTTEKKDKGAVGEGDATTAGGTSSIGGGGGNGGGAGGGANSNPFLNTQDSENHSGTTKASTQPNDTTITIDHPENNQRDNRAVPGAPGSAPVPPPAGARTHITSATTVLTSNQLLLRPPSQWSVGQLFTRFEKSVNIWRLQNQRLSDKRREKFEGMMSARHPRPEVVSSAISQSGEPTTGGLLGSTGGNTTGAGGGSRIGSMHFTHTGRLGSSTTHAQRVSATDAAPPPSGVGVRGLLSGTTTERSSPSSPPSRLTRQ